MEINRMEEKEFLLMVLKRIKIEYKVFNNIIVFNLLNLPKFLEYCQLNNILIIGFDGFRIVENNIVPDDKYIADFSGLVNEAITNKEKVQESIMASFRVYNQIVDNNADLYLEMVIRVLV